MTHYQTVNVLQAQQQLTPLGDLLQACVVDGASIGFTDPQDRLAIDQFWLTRSAELAEEASELWIALQSNRLVGCVMLGTSGMPNGQHRAEISKLLVHPQYRRQGIARQLLLLAEQRAAALGKTLLVLDTRTGDVATRLYLASGWQVAGTIPDYAQSIQGELESTTVMFKTRAK